VSHAYTVYIVWGSGISVTMPVGEGLPKVMYDSYIRNFPNLWKQNVLRFCHCYGGNAMKSLGLWQNSP